VKERGEYRPVFCRLLNGPDFLALSGIARACWYPLKLRLPVTGIGVIPALVATLAEDTGFSEAEVRGALAELETPRSHGLPWLRRQGNVVWMVRGLEFEPTMYPADAKHRKYVQRAIEALPSLEIVQAFISHYGIWFGAPQGAPVAIESPTEGPSKALASTSTTTSTSPTTKKKTRRLADAESPSPTFLRAWAAYPHRPNNSRLAAWRAWAERLGKGESEEAMLEGTVRYAAYVKHEGTDPRFVKMAATFYGRDRHYTNDFPLEPASNGKHPDLHDEPKLEWVTG
jgi:hypothetical protein